VVSDRGPVAAEGRVREESSATRGDALRGVLISLRPRQWVKNLLVFAALVFGRRLGHADEVLRVVLAFVLFCGASGAVYLINDSIDVERDRKSPEKRRRPIASGAVPVRMALAAAGVLLAATFGVAFALPSIWPGTGWGFGAILAGYFVLNLAYSFDLKGRAILDVLSIAVGFVLRVEAGGTIIGVPISTWALLCTFFLALFLALGKRRYEITAFAEGEVEHRPALRHYTPYLLDLMSVVVLTAVLVTYALYTLAPDVIQKLGTDRLYLTLPFVVYGVFRYLYLVHKHEKGGDPTETLLTDPAILVDLALWFLTAVVILYG